MLYVIKENEEFSFFCFNLDIILCSYDKLKKEVISMQIVLANLKDAKALSCLKKEIWEDTYRGIYEDVEIDKYDYKKRENKFKKLILSENQEVYVCKDRNKIIGYMVIGDPLHESIEGYNLCINDLGVSKEYQGKGIGKNFIEIAKSKNKKLFNGCNYYNAKARRFYEKMGAKISKISLDDSSKRNSQVYYVYDK